MIPYALIMNGTTFGPETYSAALPIYGFGYLLIAQFLVVVVFMLLGHRDYAGAMGLFMISEVAITFSFIVVEWFTELPEPAILFSIWLFGSAALTVTLYVILSFYGKIGEALAKGKKESENT